MAKGYRPVDRDQQFLMPPDMREWLPAGHAVWTLIDVVGLLDTSEFHARCRTGGVGRAGYDPDMMLTLLMYAYSQGIRSSRRIERLCWQDVAYRVICAQDAPDHTTIWRFADLGPELVRRLFTEVLVLCAKAGMVRLGTITLDGMKIGANASKKANQTEERIRAELAELAARAVAEHRATDAAEGTLLGETSGDELPAEFADPRSREARLRRALEELTAAREAEQAQRDTMAREYLARQRQAPVRGRVPVAAAVEAAEHRLAQAIAAQHATIEDWERCNTQRIADTGSGMPGRPPRGKRRDVEKTVRETSTPQTDQPHPDQPHPTDAVERNTQRLHTPEGIATYRRRGHIAETPHGHIKHNMGIRTLTRRGLPRATVEWKLICTTVNLAHLLRTLTPTQLTTT